MTLPAFLNAAADSKFVWLGGKRFAIPAVNARWSPRRVLGIVAVYATLAILLALLISLAVAGQPWGWLVWLLGFFAACQSFVMASLMALCWNQRAARLKQNPDSPLGLRPLRFRFGRWAMGLIYFALLGVFTPLAMVMTVENVRGQIAWSQARARLSAQGERMTIREILGPEIPARENAGAARIFAPFFDYPRESVSQSRPEVTNAIARFKDAVMTPGEYLPEKPKRTDPAPRQRENMADWAAAYRKMLAAPKDTAPAWAKTLKLPAPGDPARDVLTCLALGDGVVAEVCAAAALPRAQFPVHWDQGFDVLLQHLANLKSVQINLKLRCAAHLAAGETDAAFADATNALNVAELLREEPLLISQLVRIANGALATGTLWQGLVEHRWSDAQLAVFQDRLARVDYHAGMILGFEGERVCSTTGLDRLISNPSQLPAGEGGISLNRLARLVPFGMMRQNQVAIANYYTENLHEIRVLQTNGMQNGFAPLLQARVDREKIRWERMPYSPFTVLLKRMVPATARAEARAARGQTMNHLARSVCALERHRLAQGSYPATLDALVPTFLPKLLLDPMNARPFQYQPTDDGWFLLYSVGEDGKDDGGVFRAKAKGPILDWPWPVPTRAELGSLF
jgi:hypothetical protein